MKTAARAAILAALLAATAAAAHPLRDEARRLTDARQYAPALALYDRLVAEFPDDADLLIEAGRVEGYADHNRQAADLYARVLRVAPQRRNDVLPSLAWQTLWAGDAQGALPMFEEAAERKLDMPQSLSGAAQACTALGRHDCAEQRWRELLQRRPDDLAARKGLGRALLWQDRYAEAEHEFEAVLARQPEDREALLRLAQAKNFSGRHRAAIADYDKAGAGTGADAGERANLARALYWAGFADLGLPHLRDTDDAELRWLRDYRLERETRHYAWAGLEASRDADGLDTRSLVGGAGWRRNAAELLELTARLARLNGDDQPLQTAYADLQRADGNGILQAMNTQFTALQAALDAHQTLDATLLPASLTGSLIDKFQRVLINQRVDSVRGLGALQQQLNGASFAALRQAVAAGDYGTAQALLASADGRAMLQSLLHAVADSQQYQPAQSAVVEGREAMATYTWRLGDARTPSGTLWASLGLGGRDYTGWDSVAWRIRGRYIPRDLWTLDAEAGNGVVETLGALRNHVRFNNAAFSVRHSPDPRWSLGGGVAWQQFDDGNTRYRLAWNADYRLWNRPRLKLGMEGYVFQDDQPWNDARPNRGYYNPRRYAEDRLFTSVETEGRPWTAYAKLGLGGYRETDGWYNGSSGRSLLVEASLARDIGKQLQLRFSAGSSSSAAGSFNGGSGYWRRYFGVYLTGWL